MAKKRGCNFTGQRHGVVAKVKFDRAGDCIATAAGIDARGVVAEPANVNAEDNCAALRKQLALDCAMSKIMGNEAFSVNTREHATDTNANKVAVFAIVRDPAVELVLVADMNVAAVDSARRPAVGKAPARETVTEPALVPRRVTEGHPDDLRVTVSERALGHFPNHVRDSRTFVKDNEYALALIVQPGESLCVAFAPRHHIDPPRALVERVAGE